MNRHRASFGFFALSALLVAGCQKNVDKKDMEEAAAWSTAVCACAAKSSEAAGCMAKLKEPILDSTTESGKPKYKLDSINAYDAVKHQGDMCAAKIPR